MKLKFLSLLLFVSFSSHSSNISRIICKPSNSNGTATSAIWPQPYLLNDKLCFDIRIDSGNACVADGKTTTWFTESVIIMQNNESLGRDDTWFRVNRPTINDLRIAYTVEASRDKVNWIPQSHVTINRISGESIDWAIYEHGGTSYQCHLEGKKI
ncbi:TPA: hypothetical protein JEX60_004233 [Escherichia coli]|nr:hypothetical protein [Escherichia coli]HAU9372159.1 hypothetical protein [Escherichia coli]HAU9723933.1 hypothetical protein [Escherichia coli]